MSPKEYTNKNKNISTRTPEESSTYGGAKKNTKNDNRKIKKRVNINIRDSIFRNRIFEIYDNLNDLKSTKELVEEGIHRACKDVMVNKANDLKELGIDINIKTVLKEVKKKFPYQDFPTNNAKARNFYTATICDLLADSITELFLQEQ